MYEPWLNETYQIHSILVSQGRQNCPRQCGETMGTGEVKILLRGHSHQNSALVIEQGWGEGDEGGLQSCNSLWGLGTYTRGWEILSSYVYYYFFPAILQEAEVWHWVEWDERVGGLVRSPSLDAGLWLVKEWLVPLLGHVYSFASRKRVSWGNNFTSNNDLFGSSWVT